MNDWTHRVRPHSPTVSPEIRQIRDAALDMEQQAGRTRGKTRVIFQTVADCALIGTAVIGGALASVHLWRTLFPRHKELGQGPSPQTAAVTHTPQQPPTAAATAKTNSHDTIVPVRPAGEQGYTALPAWLKRDTYGNWFLDIVGDCFYVVGFG